jgi:protein SHQ1
MITPSFECEQNDVFVIVRVKVPHVKLSAIEYTITDKVFHFYVKPYFLRLTFECELAENGTDSCKYDIDSGVMIFNLPKRNHGEYFPDLNMITKLLSGGKSNQSPKQEQKKSLIEVVGEELNPEELREEEFQFNWEQNIPKSFATDSSLLGFEEESTININNFPTYGFDGSKSKFFASFGQDYVAEVVELRDPDTVPNEERSIIRTERENQDFDPDHYVADFVMDKEIKNLIAHKARYQKELSKKKRKKEEFAIKWNDTEQQMLLNLSKKECTLFLHYY